MTELTGVITNIQRYCVHDGPGIRTVLFMKGCPLHCIWCANPETQNFQPELAQSLTKCIGCGNCVRKCQVGALQAIEGGIKIDREKCMKCFSCVSVCYAEALHIFGETLTVQEAVKRTQNGSAWRVGGGVTVSGGEPLGQAEFVAAFLERHHKMGVHTAIETSAYASWDKLELVARQCDLVFCDIKVFDDEKHKKFTGVSNAQILENIRRITESFPNLDIIIRTPVIPGVNNQKEDIDQIVAFLETLRPIQDYELLPYHGFGAPKYKQIGKEYAMEGVPSMNKADIAAWNAEARERLHIVNTFA